MKSIRRTTPSSVVELGLEDQRVRRGTAARSTVTSPAGASSQRPFSAVAEERGEAGPRVEPGEAEPVDRAVSRDQRGGLQSPISA